MPWSSDSRSIARLVLFTFLLTFTLARMLVYGIMARDIPDMFLHVGGTHVHHLNYGIFLLTGVGAYLLFNRPEGRRLRVAAAAYAVGLGLTFDEFGMWLHMGGSYWQRASFDAVTVLATGLALIVYAPHLVAFRQRHFLVTAVAVAMVALFFSLWSRAYVFAEQSLAPHLHRLEEAGPR